VFSLSGSYVFVVAVIALIHGRVGWAWLRSRAMAVGALGIAVALTLVGGALATPSEQAPAAAPTSTSAPYASPTQDKAEHVTHTVTDGHADADAVTREVHGRPAGRSGRADREGPRPEDGVLPRPVRARLVRQRPQRL